jgi:hypothetical protein
MIERAVEFIDAAFGEGRTDMLRVWVFHQAPEPLKALSEHGGDEDWLLLIPARYDGDFFCRIAWAESGTAFGRYDVSEHLLPNGWEVRIGAHA